MEDNQIEPSLKTYSLEFGTFDIYDNVIVGVPNRDVNMGIEEARKIIVAIGHHFKGPFGYVGHRKNFNSVDPMAYLFAVQEVPDFRVMGVVNYSGVGERFLEIERAVAEAAALKFNTFSKFGEAVAWVKSTLRTI